MMGNVRFLSGLIIGLITVSIPCQGQVSAYFTFNDFQEDGDSFTDDTGLGLTGTLSGPDLADPETTEGVSGTSGDYALSFGKGSLIAKDEDWTLDTWGPVTVEAWVRSSQPEQSTDHPRWISYGAPAYAGDVYGGYALGVWQGNITFTLYGVVAIQASEVPYPFDGNWHHVAAVYEPDAGTLHIYLDGEEKQTIEENRYINAPTRNELEIGAEYPSNFQWDGEIDRVRITDGPLTQDELDSDPQNIKPITDDTLAFLHFDQESPPYEIQGRLGENGAQALTAREVIQSGVDYAKIMGSPEIVQDSPTGLPDDTCLEFSGPKNQYALVDDPDQLLAFVNDWTVEMWFKPLTGGGNRQHMMVYGGVGGGYSISTFNGDDPINIDPYFTAVITSVVDVPSTVLVPFDDQWHHLAVSFANGETLTFYLDGEEAEVIPYAGDPALEPESYALYIGSWQGGTFHFWGKLDRLRITGQALAADELDSDPANPILISRVQLWEIY